MKTWQVVILAWVVAAFAGVLAAKFSTNTLVDLGIAAGITLLAILLIRGRRAGR